MVCRHHLGKAESRLHIVEGLLTAQASLDEVVAHIRQAPDGPAAAQILQTRYKLSPEQVCNQSCHIQQMGCHRCHCSTHQDMIGGLTWKLLHS